MKACCAGPVVVAERQRRVLQVVLAINAGMFLVAFTSGLMAGSTALLADSVDMLGDAIVYGFSLYVVERGAVWHARAARLKGTIMAAFGAAILADGAVTLIRGAVPSPELMGGVGLLALAANAGVLALLWRRRADDVNMRSAWLCSRNDVVANLGVLAAAVGVATTGSAWPDILVGLAIGGLFAGSAVEVFRAARPVAIGVPTRARL